jgi:hypothetical protein
LSVLPDIEQLVEDIESENYTALVSDVLALVAPLEAAYADCFGAELKTEFFENVVSMIKEVSSRADQETLGDYPPGCYTDMLALVPYFTAQLRAMDNYETDLLIGNTHAYYTQIRDANTKCGSTSAFKESRRQLLTSSCEDGLKIILPIMLEWLNAEEYKQNSVLQNEVVYNYATLQNTANSCVNNLLNSKEDYTYAATPAGCVGDVAALVSAVERVVEEVRDREIDISDILEAVTDATTAVEECRAVDPVQLLAYLFDLLNEQEQQCAEDAFRVVREVASIVESVRQGDIDLQEILEDVEVVAEDFQVALASCRQL